MSIYQDKITTFDLKRENDDLRAEIRKLKKDNEEFQFTHKEKSKMDHEIIENLKIQWVRQQETIESLKNTQKATENRVTDLLGKNDSLKMDLTAVSDKKEVQNTQITTLQGSITALYHEIDKIEDKLIRSRQKCKRSKKKAIIAKGFLNEERKKNTKHLKKLEYSSSSALERMKLFQQHSVTFQNRDLDEKVELLVSSLEDIVKSIH